MLDKILEPSSLAVIAATTVQFALFLRWLYRRVRNDELMHAFVADMATSHLPHIYDLLARLCDQQGVTRPPAPPICWIDGHSVWVPAYNTTGPVCVTWGALKQITWAGWARYCDEAHAIVSPAWMDKEGRAASGLDYAALRIDTQKILDMPSPS